MSLAAGSRLGPWEIASPLGAGGMGEVYRARDTRLSHEVANMVVDSGLTKLLPARHRGPRRLISAELGGFSRRPRVWSISWMSAFARAPGPSL